MCRDRLTAVANLLTWWVMKRRYQKFSERTPFLMAAPPGRLDSTGTTGSMKAARVDQPQHLVQLLPGAPEGGVAQEELLELALRLRRQVPRGPPPPDLVVDLGPDPGQIAPVGLVDTGCGCGRVGRPVVVHMTSSAGPAGVRHR